MFHLVPYVNIVLNILLCSPFFVRNNNIYCTIQAHLYFYITSYNVIFSDIFVLKHIFKACNYTIYCLIKSTLYFQKNVLYCPIITFIFLQNVINSPIFVQYCPKKHIFKACNNTIYCLIQEYQLHVDMNGLPNGRATRQIRFIDPGFYSSKIRSARDYVPSANMKELAVEAEERKKFKKEAK